ncbi:hypothetical protein M1L60_01215 [Actinoplanes sp. TRM 88003]|uniref:Uncharacterized protein n=1 Tax=Paractinoplanes aksuensis TaxID=2939490 RepID=A0ABT1DEI2_9ACTN|nr:hypothetical protein [Actinoplanes aksuensis]MCO8269205.1 hypothetical protein [Actinoplanes aksuensis]
MTIDLINAVTAVTRCRRLVIGLSFVAPTPWTTRADITGPPPVDTDSQSQTYSDAAPEDLLADVPPAKASGETTSHAQTPGTTFHARTEGMPSGTSRARKIGVSAGTTAHTHTTGVSASATSHAWTVGLPLGLAVDGWMAGAS